MSGGRAVAILNSNEVMLRNEIAFRDLRAFLAEQRLALRGLAHEIAEFGRRMDRRTEEILAEGRAQRKALFRILDRLDGHSGPAAGESS